MSTEKAAVTQQFGFQVLTAIVGTESADTLKGKGTGWVTNLHFHAVS